MTRHDDPVVLELEARECWRLLRSASVGRLSVASGGVPDIFPINYAVDHGSIVFRTAEGTKLSAVVANSAVAFEVDGWDPQGQVAWSVVLAGRGKRIKGTDELIDSMRLPLYPWHPGRKECLVRIIADRATGRQFAKADPAIWRTWVADAPRTAAE